MGGKEDPVRSGNLETPTFSTAAPSFQLPSRAFNPVNLDVRLGDGFTGPVGAVSGPADSFIYTPAVTTHS